MKMFSDDFSQNNDDEGSGKMFSGWRDPNPDREVNMFSHWKDEVLAEIPTDFSGSESDWVRELHNRGYHNATINNYREVRISKTDIDDITKSNR
jgi:hypothetical protein